MHLPTISQYASSISEPIALTKTLGEFSAERDNYGEIKIRTGNNACVFHISCDRGEFMLKCYIRPRNDLKDIYRYISFSEDPLFPDASLLEKELYVFDHFGEGRFYDVVCAPWVEGATLDTEIRRACRERDTGRLLSLSKAFDELAFELLSREWAHGDLKPENIVVHPDGSLSLIDFDALYFPDNPAVSHSEIGTPGYQHPGREEGLYEKCLDDYPLALISASLRAVSVDPSLYAKYNRSDILVINPSEIQAGACEAYRELKKVLAEAGCTGHYKLALLLASAHPRLDGVSAVFARIIRPAGLSANSEVFRQGEHYGYRLQTADNPVLIDAVFEEALPFREGTAVVSLAGRRRILDLTGKFLLGDIIYDDIKPFTEGLAAICIEGRWGYISVDGRMVVEPEYEAAGNMHCGFAPVMSGGLWGYINRNGVPVTGFDYRKALGVRNGIAKVWMGDKMVTICL